jgi:hypothetical protein
MKVKYKLQYFDSSANAWATFYNYTTIVEALRACPAVAANKLAKVRIAIDVEAVIYEYPGQ